MKDPKDIVIIPVITEKGSNLRTEQNKYIFQVAKTANKIEIKRAVEELFKIKVEKVTTMIVHGKTKRVGRFEGKRADWKKAIVELKKDQKIEFFENV
jgi:large subunit ribosomal protein L23